MSVQTTVKFKEAGTGHVVFTVDCNRELLITFPSESMLRVRIKKTGSAQPSVMVKLGYIKEILSETSINVKELSDAYVVFTNRITVTIRKSDSMIQYLDKTESILGTIDISQAKLENSSVLSFSMAEAESFYGFGFQRKTFNSRGHKLTFKKEYRWNEATVPYFMSTSGYGFFSANTYDHEFDFTGAANYKVTISGGDIDFFILFGPSFKDIIENYTALTGRPQMVPKWAIGLCYVARLFETQAGLLEIADRFRKEGIPCDMLGLEPGWEKYYYQMKWVWNDELFPDPKGMIEKLHEMGFSFELWESGDAPTSGYMNSENRKKWFASRIKTSLGIGVDFFKQDDPYPRCITSEEMVTEPSVEVFLEDDGEYSEAETRNIANTLYSSTVFNEFKRLTNKRTIVIFHSYGATISSQKYPLAWAGDFKLGNGALNASLSGHSMVTQDMRNETPSGIHFGFLIPFPFMDSWAYYLEPWLFSDFIKETIRFYSRLRSALFPYLYSAQRLSYTKGIPMLRPMILEFQDDKKTYNIDNQFMLGNSFLVGTNEERGSGIYLPRGKWVDYWTKNQIESSGEYIGCTWPSYAGGPLFVKSGSIIPMFIAADSVSLSEGDLLITDIYPCEKSYMELYEDDGISYHYESGKFAATLIECRSTDISTEVIIGKPAGEYSGMPLNRSFLIKIHMQNSPDSVKTESVALENSPSLGELLNSYKNGWFYDSAKNTLFIKPDSSWKFDIIPFDTVTFYGCRIVRVDSGIEQQEVILSILHKTKNNKPEATPVVPDTTIPSGDLTFKAVINPPERVKLNYGDSWLPYYAYLGFEITCNGQRSCSACQEVTMQVLKSENGIVLQEFKVTAFEGTGYFPRITLGSPKEPPDVWIKLSAMGVNSVLIHYKINESQN